MINFLYYDGQFLFFKPPFFYWPTFTQEALNDCKDIELAAYCMHSTPGAKSAGETVIPQRNLAKILLDILRHTKCKIMEQEKYFDDHSDLQNLLMDGHMLPSIAIDYANMALMIGNGNPDINIYTISTDTVNRLYDEGWNIARRDFKKEYPNMMSEFDLIKDQCKNKRARFIIPFLHDSKQWLNIVRAIIDDCISFLLSDCSDDTMDDYEVEDEEEIPLNVMWTFMDSPLWPIKKTAYWIKLPNIQEVEEESGARCFLHGYIIANFLAMQHSICHC
jgi:hypothetical protein